MKTPNAVVAAIACRCPNCRRGALFEGFLKVRPSCEACGFDLSEADSGDGPVVFILLIVGAIGCFGLLFSEIAWRPPVWLEVAIWLPAMAILTLVAMRPFKSILLTIQFRTRASGSGQPDDQAP